MAMRGNLTPLVPAPPPSGGAGFHKALLRQRLGNAPPGPPALPAGRHPSPGVSTRTPHAGRNRQAMCPNLMWSALAPRGYRTPMVVGTYLGEGFALVGAKTPSRVPQGDAVDHLGRRGNAKQLMHLFFHLGMQGGNGGGDPPVRVFPHRVVWPTRLHGTGCQAAPVRRHP
jgi:hypothetical protein